ncbi:piggybac transposable element-derived protein 4 [Holotrichia oblita]|uniref:Piggybac transposable element-derived protein 4 n=1 Tax=Holotrichia oblita TaxID=644536 RepID=A0ACB9SKU2_HOLOL|nr:piggybac transposable element-derived protein 4 [Holotrichia oblita]
MNKWERKRPLTESELVAALYASDDEFDDMNIEENCSDADEDYVEEMRASESDDESDISSTDEVENVESNTELSGITHTVSGRTWRYVSDRPSCKTLAHNVIQEKVESLTDSSRNISTILDALKLFISDDIVGIIVQHTNNKANDDVKNWNENHESEKPREWQNIDSEELLAFFGLLLLSGRFRESREDPTNLWKENEACGRNVYQATMSRKRFTNILQYIRFDDLLTRPERLLLVKPVIERRASRIERDGRGFSAAIVRAIESTGRKLKLNKTSTRSKRGRCHQCRGNDSKYSKRCSSCNRGENHVRTLCNASRRNELFTDQHNRREKPTPPDLQATLKVLDYYFSDQIRDKNCEIYTVYQKCKDESPTVINNNNDHNIIDAMPLTESIIDNMPLQIDEITSFAEQTDQLGNLLLGTRNLDLETKNEELRKFRKKNKLSDINNSRSKTTDLGEEDLDKQVNYSVEEKCPARSDDCDNSSNLLRLADHGEKSLETNCDIIATNCDIKESHTSFSSLVINKNDTLQDSTVNNVNIQDAYSGQDS